MYSITLVLELKAEFSRLRDSLETVGIVNVTRRLSVVA